MMKADDFMDGFMNKLKADSFAKDNQPNKESEVNEEFFNEQLSSYINLLNSGIIEKTTYTK